MYMEVIKPLKSFYFIVSFLMISMVMSLLGVKNYNLISNYKSHMDNFIPSDSCMYSKVNIYPFLYQLKTSKEGSEPVGIKIFNDMAKKYEEKTGTNLKDELLSVAGSEIAVSFFNFEKSYDYLIGSIRFEKCEGELNNITYALSMYYEKNKCYPAELKELVPDYMENIPTCPAGGQYVYKTTDKEKQSFSLECTGNVHEKAGVKGNFPAFKGEKENIEPVACEKNVPDSAYPDWLTVIDITDRQKVEEIIKTILPKKQLTVSISEYKERKIFNIKEKDIYYFITDKNLFIASKGELIKKSLDGSSDTMENISKNKIYSSFREKKIENFLYLTFFNMESFMPYIAKDLENEQFGKFLSPAITSLKSLSFTASGTPGGLKMDTFLNIDKENNSNIVKFLFEETPGQAGSLKLIPEDTTVFSSYSDIKVIWNIARDIMTYYPELQQEFDNGKQMFTMFTQKDIEKDIVDNLTGEMAVSMTVTKEYLKKAENVKNLYQCESAIRSIAWGVEEYQKEHKGNLPKTIEELMPEMVGDISAPFGGKYIIVPIDKKAEKGKYPPFYVAYSGTFPKEYGIPKNFPRYYSDTNSYTLGKDKNGKEISAGTPPSPDCIFIFGTKDKKPLEDLMALWKTLGSAGKEVKYKGSAFHFTSFDGITMAYGFSGNYLIFTMGDTYLPMKKVIDIQVKDRKSIVDGINYNIAKKHISGEEIVENSYININTFLKFAKEEGISNIPSGENQEMENIKNLGEESLKMFTFAWSFCEKKKDGFHWSVFMPLNFK